MRRRLPTRKPGFSIRQPWLIFLLLFWAIVPDLDVIPGFLVGDLGSFHNNLTHSLTAAVVFSAMAALILSWINRCSPTTWFIALFLCYGSHVLLDFVTYSERGLLLLWPFDLKRYESGVALFYGVRWSEGLISYHHLVTMVSELAFAGIVVGCFWGWERMKLLSTKSDSSRKYQ